MANQSNLSYLDNPNLEKYFTSLGINRGNADKVSGQFDTVVDQVRSIGIKNLDCISPYNNGGALDTKKVTNATPHSFAVLMLFIMQGIASSLPKAVRYHFERVIKMSTDPLTSAFTLEKEIWNTAINSLPKTPKNLRYRKVNKDFTPKTVVQRIRSDANSQLGKLAKALTPKKDPENITFKKKFHTDIDRLLTRINNVDGATKPCKSVKKIDIDKVKSHLIHLKAILK
tara:strand:- start:57 stop:740 length:684 start_codon:yes stop_codon:yes gene_type:complete